MARRREQPPAEQAGGVSPDPVASAPDPVAATDPANAVRATGRITGRRGTTLVVRHRQMTFVGAAPSSDQATREEC